MTLRIGIDVGGTFTDVVAIDVASHTIVARIKVPTTHRAATGVAAGIVEGLQRVLAQPGISADAIRFLAHSTTQATNALLEGDVAQVGVVGIVDRFDAPFVRGQVRLPPMALAPGAVFAPATAFVRADDPKDDASVLERLVARGCTSIAASAAFGVDRTELEERIVARARERGIAATAGHHVASTYGLRVRTRTAALNAAILPTMVRTAEMTANAAAAAGIAVPMMIMRSDGGVMDVREMQRRPILTMLSGPAAGLAGALLHDNVTDGIFIETGGTSSDLSVIRRGRPQMRPARVGGHRTLLRTLDVRTLAIAGGSLLRMEPGGLVREVGPRSAHIAGMRYASFTPLEAIRTARAELVSPRDGDPADCLALIATDGSRIALTPTCAANALGRVPDEAFARGNGDAAALAFQIAGVRVGVAGEQLAELLLERACVKLRATVEELMRDYGLDSSTVDLIGGGGGAAALVPSLARAMGLPHRLARDAEVIAPVGVALALVRDSVERTIANPTPDDILRVRREAVERVVAAGASPALVEVAVELEPRRNLVRATASGATEAASTQNGAAAVSDDLAGAAARALHVDRTALRPVAEIERFAVFLAHRTRREPPWLRILRREWKDACVVDRFGVARLVATRVLVRCIARSQCGELLPRLLEDGTAFGDVGRALPDCTLVYGSRIADLSGLAEAAQVVALAEEELRGLDACEPVIVIVAERDV